MKKFTKEQIEEIVTDAMKIISENASEILLGSIDNCISSTEEIEDKKFAGQLNDVVIPASTAYQMSVYTMEIVLCKLLCEEEGMD